MAARLNQNLFLTLFLILVLIASAGDLSADLIQGVNNTHLVQEAVTLVAALIGLGWLVYNHQHQKKEILRLKKIIQENASEQLASEELIKAKRGLADAIKQQFDQWQLTPSEKEVGLMLLKGFSVKEISLLRGTTEKTIRHHASSTYQKAGLNGRHAFSAWFIEDYL